MFFFFFGVFDYHWYNHSFTTDTMVKLRLVHRNHAGYTGLPTITMWVFFVVVKAWSVVTRVKLSLVFVIFLGEWRLQ